MSSTGTICSSCGANINVDPQYGIAECPYCGSIYSDPSVTAGQRRAYALAQQRSKDTQRADLASYDRQYKKRHKLGVIPRLMLAFIVIGVLMAFLLALIGQTTVDQAS